MSTCPQMLTWHLIKFNSQVTLATNHKPRYRDDLYPTLVRSALRYSSKTWPDGGQVVLQSRLRRLSLRSSGEKGK